MVHGVMLEVFRQRRKNLAVLSAKVGANIQRLKMTDQQVSILNENLTAARSRIQDVNIADESTR